MPSLARALRARGARIGSAGGVREAGGADSVRVMVWLLSSESRTGDARGARRAGARDPGVEPREIVVEAAVPVERRHQLANAAMERLERLARPERAVRLDPLRAQSSSAATMRRTFRTSASAFIAACMAKLT